jgi:hypothetical protein
MTACGPERRKSISAPMSAIEVLSGLLVLTMSFVVDDPKPPFSGQSSCKPRPNNSCPCQCMEPTPTDITRPGPTRAPASGPQFPRKELICRLGHDVAAADIDAGGSEGAVRLLGGGGGRDGGTGF